MLCVEPVSLEMATPVAAASVAQSRSVRDAALATRGRASCGLKTAVSGKARTQVCQSSEQAPQARKERRGGRTMLNACLPAPCAPGPILGETPGAILGETPGAPTGWKICPVSFRGPVRHQQVKRALESP